MSWTRFLDVVIAGLILVALLRLLAEWLGEMTG